MTQRSQKAPTAGGAPVIVGDYTGMVSGLQVIDGVVYTTGTHGLQRSDAQQGGVMVDLFNQQPAISPLAKTTHGLAFGVANDLFLACGQ